MMLQEPVRIRDFVITKNNWIYAVVSYDNEPHICGFLRYIPDKNGDRVAGTVRGFAKSASKKHGS